MLTDVNNISHIGNQHTFDLKELPAPHKERNPCKKSTDQTRSAANSETLRPLSSASVSVTSNTNVPTISRCKGEGDEPAVQYYKEYMFCHV